MKRILSFLLCLLMLAALCACAQSAPAAPPETEAPAPSPAPETSAPLSETPSPSPAVADASQMTTVEEVVEPGMTPVYADSLTDGDYPVQVKSSSSMFRIESAVLHVRDGKLSATLTLGSKSYLALYPGSALEAATADESGRIPYTEDANGAYAFTIPVEALDAPVPCAAFSKNKQLWYDRTLLFRADSLPIDAFRAGFFATAESLGLADGAYAFTVPVEALDAPVPCAAFSKNKQLWYDRTLLFRADSLPTEAFRAGFFTTAESLGLADGDYSVEVTLGGGSGRASVQSPCRLRVENGVCTAEIVWGSANYDYMRLDDEVYLPVNTEGNSVFWIPVAFFDRSLPVIADTTAMSQPHEIEYTLCFDSAAITAAP